MTNLLVPTFSSNNIVTVAPYGSSDIEDLESVFEKVDLKQHAIFLDTQCTCFICDFDNSQLI